MRELGVELSRRVKPAGSTRPSGSIYKAVCDLEAGEDKPIGAVEREGQPPAAAQGTRLLPPTPVPVSVGFDPLGTRRRR